MLKKILPIMAIFAAFFMVTPGFASAYEVTRNTDVEVYLDANSDYLEESMNMLNMTEVNPYNSTIVPMMDEYQDMSGIVQCPGLFPSSTNYTSGNDANTSRKNITLHASDEDFRVTANRQTLVYAEDLSPSGTTDVSDQLYYGTQIYIMNGTYTDPIDDPTPLELTSGVEAIISHSVGSDTGVLTITSDYTVQENDILALLMTGGNTNPPTAADSIAYFDLNENNIETIYADDWTIRYEMTATRIYTGGSVAEDVGIRIIDMDVQETFWEESGDSVVAFPLIPSKELLFDSASETWLRTPLVPGEYNLSIAIFEVFRKDYTPVLAHDIFNSTPDVYVSGETRWSEVWKTPKVPENWLREAEYELNWTEGEETHYQNYSFLWLRTNAVLTAGQEYVVMLQINNDTVANRTIYVSPNDMGKDSSYRSWVYTNRTQYDLPIDMDYAAIYTNLLSDGIGGMTIRGAGFSESETEFKTFHLTSVDIGGGEYELNETQQGTPQNVQTGSSLTSTIDHSVTIKINGVDTIYTDTNTLSGTGYTNFLATMSSYDIEFGDYIEVTYGSSGYYKTFKSDPFTTNYTLQSSLAVVTIYITQVYSAPNYLWYSKIGDVATDAKITYFEVLEVQELPEDVYEKIYYENNFDDIYLEAGPTKYISIIMPVYASSAGKLNFTICTDIEATVICLEGVYNLTQGMNTVVWTTDGSGDAFDINGVRFEFYSWDIEEITFYTRDYLNSTQHSTFKYEGETDWVHYDTCCLESDIENVTHYTKQGLFMNMIIGTEHYDIVEMNNTFLTPYAYNHTQAYERRVAIEWYEIVLENEETGETQSETLKWMFVGALLGGVYGAAAGYLVAEFWQYLPGWAQDGITNVIDVISEFGAWVVSPFTNPDGIGAKIWNFIVLIVESVVQLVILALKFIASFGIWACMALTLIASKTICTAFKKGFYARKKKQIFNARVMKETIDNGMKEWRTIFGYVAIFYLILYNIASLVFQAVPL